MTAGAAQTFLDSFHNLEASRAYDLAAMGLSRVRELMKRACVTLPCAVVHVAGSKGKGSTCECIARVAAAAGYRVGVYMSPHVYAFGERIRILTASDGEGQISDADFAEQIEALREHAEALRSQGLTYFEIVTVAAFQYFAAKSVDIAVIEVGLGGRLDATNVVDPSVCVITDIALEHTQTLGDTLGKIAGEKAGIVKEGVPLVATSDVPEVLSAFENVCAEKQAPLFRYGKEFGDAAQQSAFRGEHQKKNTAAAVKALQLLSAKGFSVSDDAIENGLRAVHLPARFEEVMIDGKSWIFDMAHTPESVAALRIEIEKEFQGKRVGYLFGCKPDKNVVGMREALSGCAMLDLCNADWAKLDAMRLRSFVCDCDVVVVTGSAYLCAALRSVFLS